MTQTDQAHVTDGMIIEWDVPVEMDDGLQLRADIFRPPGRDPTPCCYHTVHTPREPTSRPDMPQHGTAWRATTQR